MKKKSKRMLLGTVALFALGGAALVSCGETPTSSDSSQSSKSTDAKAVAMRVKGGEPLVFQQGYVVLSDEQGLDDAFDEVVIELLDANQNVVKEVAMAESSGFHHGEIDTSAIVDAASFDLTYTEGDLTIRASVPYRVIVAQLAGWSANQEYVKFTQTSNTVSEEKNIQTGNAHPFMKKTSFYVGNYNEMSLFPVVSVRNPDVHSAAVDTLDATKVSAKLLNASNAEVPLANYMSEAAIADLLAHGKVKFNEGVQGSFTLVFQYGGGASQTLFPDLSYKIEVVDGYNINRAEELFVLSNDDVDDSVDTEGPTNNDARIAAWKAAKGLPAFNEKYHTGIIQCDITLTKDNIPDYYIWNVQRDQCNSLLEGSFRDYTFLVKRTFLPSYQEANLKFNMYGNYHNLQFSADFPRITKMGYEDGEPQGRMVESHASLFGIFTKESVEGYEDGMFGKKCHATIQDIHGIGNHGIDTDSELPNSGMLYLKNYVDVTMKNNVLNKWYTTAVMCNSVEDGPAAQTVVDVDSCRFDDTYNACLFNWHNCAVNVINSEITNAGGPLIFNQCYLADASDIGSEFAAVADNSFSKCPVASINVDSASYLENWTMGRGGWFALYNSEQAVGELKAVNQAIYGFTGGQSSFLDNGFTDPTAHASGRFNFICLNMPAGNTLVPEQGAIIAKNVIGGKTYVSYDDGRVETLTKLNQADFSPLWTTNFGARCILDVMFGAAPQSLLFSTLNADGNPVFMAPVDANFTLQSLQSIVMNNLRSMDPSITDEQIEAVAPIDPAFSTSDYLTIGLLGSNQGFLNNPANPFETYLGSNAMTMLLTMDHPQ